MPTYRAEVPIAINSSQRNDRQGFRTSWGARINTELVWNALRCRLISLDPTVVRAVFDEVVADHEAAAYEIVSGALAFIVPFVSLEVQREHVNRHYGPLRATWERAAVDITPHDNWPAGSVAARMESIVGFNNPDAQLAVLSGTPELRLLLLSYDRALAPDDDESRFFNAFAIIEFVESRFSTRARFPPLLTDAVAEEILTATTTRAQQLVPDQQIVQRIRNLVSSPLRRATLENREAKLLAILRDDFGVTSVTDATGPTEIDVAFVRRLTDARNRLFHGAAGADAAAFPRLTDKLTLVVEGILRALLERSVAIPPPMAALGQAALAAVP